MSALAAIMVALAVVSVLAIGTLVWFHILTTQAERDHQRVMQEQRDAQRNEAYAKIATDGRTVDDTAGMLDDGRFFMPSDQDLHPDGTEGRSRGNPRGA